MITPLNGVHDETIYGVLNEKRGSRSWLDKCNELEGALVKAGWTPPAGHPLAVSPAPLSLGWSVAMRDRQMTTYGNPVGSARAALEDWDSEDEDEIGEVFAAIYGRAPSDDEDAFSLIFAAVDVLTVDEAKRVLAVLG